MSRTNAQQNAHEYFGALKDIKDKYCDNGFMYQNGVISTETQTSYLDELYKVIAGQKEKPAAQRYGNQRKMRAGIKRDERRQDKRKEQQKFKLDLKKM